jgi:hypothetical protein
MKCRFILYIYGLVLRFKMHFYLQLASIHGYDHPHELSHEIFV